MKKCCFFMSMFFLITPALPLLSTSVIPKSSNTCHIPAINPLFLFPFGQKSDDLKIQCVQDGFSKFEIISHKLIIDRDDIGRLEFYPIQIDTKKKFSSIDPELNDKNLTLNPTLLFFKKKINSIIGIELCFPREEQAIFKIERIALFFIQNITKKNSEKYSTTLGFNKLPIYNTKDGNQNMLIIGETNEQKKEIQNLIKELFERIKPKNTLLKIIADAIKKVISSLEKNTIGLIVERTHRVAHILGEYNLLKNISYALLSGQDYLIFNKRNESARNLITLIQENKMPLTSNYYLYGRIMDYTEEQILFKYQLEGYLRSIKNINADGTTLWPYNIPKWVERNKTSFDAWIKNKWSVYFSYFYPAERKQYENDKKTAQKYIDKLPLTKEEAIKSLKTVEKKSNMLQYLGLLSKIREKSKNQTDFDHWKFKKLKTELDYGKFKFKTEPKISEWKTNASQDKFAQNTKKAVVALKKSPTTPSDWDSYSQKIKDLSIIEWLSNAYLDDLINNKTENLNLLELEFDAKLFTEQMKNNAEKFITKPIMNGIIFLEKTKKLIKEKTLEKSNIENDYVNKLVSAIVKGLNYNDGEKELLLKKFNDKIDQLNEFKNLLSIYFTSNNIKDKNNLLEFFVTKMIKFGYNRIKVLSNLSSEKIPELTDSVESKDIMSFNDTEKKKINFIPVEINVNPETIIAKLPPVKEKNPDRNLLEELKRLEGLSDKQLQEELKLNNKKPQEKSWWKSLFN